MILLYVVKNESINWLYYEYVEFHSNETFIVLARYSILIKYLLTYLTFIIKFDFEFFKWNFIGIFFCSKFYTNLNLGNINEWSSMNFSSAASWKLFSFIELFFFSHMPMKCSRRLWWKCNKRRKNKWRSNSIHSSLCKWDVIYHSEIGFFLSYYS